MEPVTSKLKRTRLFAHLPDEAIVALIERARRRQGRGRRHRCRRSQGDLVVLLEGGLAMGSNDGGEHIAAFSVDEDARDPAILYTIPAGARLHAQPPLGLSRHRRRSGSTTLLRGRQEAKSLAALDESVRERVASLLKARSPSSSMPFEHLVRCAEAMQEVEVDDRRGGRHPGRPGRLLLRHQGGRGRGAARRQRAQSRVKVATLGPGASFGEEALLKGEPRNATVRMTTPGRVLKLGKEDFDALLKSQLLHEIGAEEARRNADFSDAVLIDCRFEEEWELWRLKNARLVPLEEIRERSRGLDPKREYIVYCRTGRRSRARRIPDAPGRPQRRLAHRAASPPGPTSARPAS